MHHPGTAIGKALLGVGREPIDHDPRQIVLAHIGDSRLIDQACRITGQEHLEEIQPALGTRRSEGRKLIVANMRAETVLGFVERAPVSSTVIHAAEDSPVRSTSRASLRKVSWPSMSSRITCRLEITMPMSLSRLTRRGTVTWPCTYCEMTKRLSSAPKW